jgi:hypothetical protein
MTELYTLVEFMCLPTLDFKSSVKLVSIGLMTGIIAAIMALTLHRNQKSTAMKIIIVALVVITTVVIIIAVRMSSFKCDVTLADGSRQVEKVVVTHRYPQLNMPAVIIPRENRLPLMNRLYSSEDRKDPSNTDER